MSSSVFSKFQTLSQMSFLQATNPANLASPINKKTGISYGAIGSAVVASSLLGITHGMYKRFEKDSFEMVLKPLPKESSSLRIALALLNPKSVPDDKWTVALAMLKPVPVENKDVKVVIKTHVGHSKEISEILGDSKSITELFRNKNTSPKIIMFLKELMGKGFDPDKNNLIDYVSEMNLKEFNKNNSFGINIGFIDKESHNLVQFTENGFEKIIHKSWKLFPGGVVEMGIKEEGFKWLPSEVVELIEKVDPPKKSKKTFDNKQILFFKKIWNPLDKKVANIIAKLPGGKKFVGYMRKTDAPIKQISFKPLHHYFYDKTSMLKGSTAMGILSLASAAVYIATKKIKDRT